MEKYELGKSLGSGSFGDVLLVENKKTAELFAMKRIQRGEMIDNYVAREIINQKSLYHPNVIQFKEARYYFQQLILGVSYLHSKSGRLHLKPKSEVGTPKYSAPEMSV